MKILTLFMFGLMLAVPASAQAEEIHGCVKGKKGKLRIVAEGVACKKKETPISWSVAGPTGEKGEPGEDGAKGDTGATGATGDQGEPGTPAIAPALANAIYDAIGIRIRELPIKNHDLKVEDLGSRDVA